MIIYSFISTFRDKNLYNYFCTSLNNPVKQTCAATQNDMCGEH